MNISSEKLTIEDKLLGKMYKSAFDPIRKRFVQINNVKINNNIMVIIGKSAGDCKSMTYKFSELIAYGH